MARVGPTLQSILIAAVGACGVLSSCGGSSKQTSDDRGGGGDAGANSGTGTGGSDVAGSGVGGSSTGGNSTGGNATGGDATGGNATGGDATGGDATGGQAGKAMGGGAGAAGARPGGSGGKGGGGSGGSGGSGGTGGSSGTAGSGGARPGPHCDGVPPICGPMGSSSCCASSVVPGGTFNRSNDAAAPATVSEFRLDTYEVTVGRYRQFHANYLTNLPASGSGKNPNNPADPGWDAAWTTLLEERPAASSCGSRGTWTAQPGANEALPMNCVGWYGALAFCIWDEGRLPTEAEWNYAAAGGTEQRVYPWSNPPASTVIDMTYAVYGGSVSTVVIPVVGSKSPKGDARWGHADMAGSMFEWAQDYYASYPVPCADCAILSPTMVSSARIDRGGSHYHDPSSARTAYRSQLQPQSGSDNTGWRCARRP